MGKAVSFIVYIKRKGLFNIKSRHIKQKVIQFYVDTCEPANILVEGDFYELS